MAILAPHTGKRGKYLYKMMVPSTHVELMEEISRGDGLVWQGDDRLSVNWDSRMGQYCIVRYCEDGKTRPTGLFYKPEDFNKLVLHDLAQADLRSGRNDVLSRVEKSVASYERDQARQAADADAEIADVADFILRKYT